MKFNQSTLKDNQEEKVDIFENIIINERCKLFNDNEFAIKIWHCFFANKKKCSKCDNLLKCASRSRKYNSKILRCVNNDCRKEFNLLYGSPFSSVKIKISDLFFIIFKFIKSSFQYDILSEVNISKPSLIKIIKIIQKKLKNENEKEEYKMGGQNVIVQIDETAVSRKGKIICPTTSCEMTRKTKWLLWIINESNFLDFKLI